MNGTSQEHSDKDSEKRAFAERYLLCINHLGLKDADVSRRSGIPKNTLSRWANGRSVPEAKHLFNLADVLRVNPRWLITGEGHRQPVEEMRLDGSGEGELVSLFRSLDEDGRKHLLKTATLLWNERISQRIHEVSTERSAGQTLHDGRKDYGPAP